MELFHLLNNDVVLGQQSRNPIRGKLRLFDFIVLWIECVIECRSKICLLDYGSIENCAGEIACIKTCTSQIAFRKINFLQAAISEYGLLQFQFIKRREIQHAIFKANFE